eukprot:gene8232-biopygen16614
MEHWGSAATAAATAARWRSDKFYPHRGGGGGGEGRCHGGNPAGITGQWRECGADDVCISQAFGGVVCDPLGATIKDTVSFYRLSEK